MPIERDREQVKQLARDLTEPIEDLLGDNCHGYRPGRDCDSARLMLQRLRAQSQRSTFKTSSRALTTNACSGN
jgi:hypothetical protein